MLPTRLWWSNNEFNIKGAVYEQTKGFCLILCLYDLSSDSALLTAVKHRRSSCHMSPGSLPLRIDVIFGAWRNFHVFYRCQKIQIKYAKDRKREKRLWADFKKYHWQQQWGSDHRGPPPVYIIHWIHWIWINYCTHCHLHTSQYTIQPTVSMF